MMSHVEVGFSGMPALSAQVADAAEGVVALLGHLVHVVSLLRAFSDVVAVEATSQGSLDAAAEVGERVAQQPGLLVLDGLGKGPSIWRDDGRAAELRFDVNAAEGFEVHGRCQQAGEASEECAAVGTM